MLSLLYLEEQHEDLKHTFLIRSSCPGGGAAGAGLSGPAGALGASGTSRSQLGTSADASTLFSSFPASIGDLCNEELICLDRILIFLGQWDNFLQHLLSGAATQAVLFAKNCAAITGPKSRLNYTKITWEWKAVAGEVLLSIIPLTSLVCLSQGVLPQAMKHQATLPARG